MSIFTVLVFAVAFVVTYGAKCGDISGTTWQNELGSRMSVIVDDSKRISGVYFTAVETNPGAAKFVSNITGLISKQGDGSLVAFSVLFNHGSSLASWVGQCLVCEGKEVLFTTYTLSRYESDYQNKWKAILVNQNTFRRIEDVAENIEISGPPRFRWMKILSVVSSKPPGGLKLDGKWKSDNNEELEISVTNEGVLEGKHHTTDVIGRKDGNDMFTAVTVMSSSSKRIRSWTGYVYNTFPSSPQILETSWLEHEFSPSCASARNMVRFGTQNYTKIAERSENIVNKSETFLDKIRKFFSSMF